MSNELKRCRRCGKEKSLDEFYENKSSYSGYDTSCKQCRIAFGRDRRKLWTKNNKKKCAVLHAKNRRKYRKEKPEVLVLRNRKHQLKAYGITLEQYDAMFESQNGVCAVCGKEETAKNQFGVRRLAIDHDHKTGEVRGLLCSRCNLGIGYLQDDVDTLLNAANYLLEE